MNRVFSLLITLLAFITTCPASNPELKGYVQKNLSERQITNLQALSKLYGYTRYFYPNQQMAEYQELDWYKFLVMAIDKTIDADSDEQLAAELNIIFEPIIPELLFNLGTTCKKQKLELPYYYWQHIGIGEEPTGENLYSNKIVSTQVIADSIPTPNKLYTYRISDELTVHFPLAISYQHTKPSKELKALKEEVKKVKFELFDDDVFQILMKNKATPKLFDDHKLRYADLMIHWNIIQHFYPYYDEDKLADTWQDRLSKAFTRAALVGKTIEYLETVNWLMAGVNDSYIEVVPNLNLERIGGMYFTPLVPYMEIDWRDKSTITINKIDTTFAHKIKQGDELISINGIPTDSIIASKWDYIAASTRQSRKQKMVTKFLLRSYTKDSTLQLGVKNRADEITYIDVKTDIEEQAYLPSTRPFVEEKDNVYTIDITSYGDDASYKHFKEIIPQLQKAEKIIIDLQGYPNSKYTDSIVLHFAKTKVLMKKFDMPCRRFPDQQNVEYLEHTDDYFDLVNSSQYIATPLTVLINSKTISYGETVTDMFINHTHAKIVGEPTAGANGNTTIIKTCVFPFYMTGTKDVSGRHGKGIIPIKE